jgi:hypothetical protein
MTEAHDEEERSERILARRKAAVEREDGRPPWLVVGIGMLMLAILLVANVITVFENQESESRQDRLAECFRRVILTINVRTSYTEEIRDIDNQITDAPTKMVQEFVIADGPDAQQATLNRYLKNVEGLRKQRSEAIGKQREYRYPDLEDCESA